MGGRVAGWQRQIYFRSCASLLQICAYEGYAATETVIEYSQGVWVTVYARVSREVGKRKAGDRERNVAPLGGKSADSSKFSVEKNKQNNGKNLTLLGPL